MSRSTNNTFTCPCGEVFTSPIYEYVNVEKDPQLRYTVLAGLLNVSTCPNCGRKAAVARPFIYSDPAHQLLAFVHPRSDVPEDARLLILDRLRSVYLSIEAGMNNGHATTGGQTHARAAASIDRKTAGERELPPLKVIFGLEQLTELITTTVSPDERLGRLALSTPSDNSAERGRLLDIARKFAQEMTCQVEVEELPDEYTVWLYGSRRQIGAIMHALARG